VRLVLGPIDSSGAILWIAYARTVLAELVTHRGRPVAIDEDVVERFESILDEWEDVARATGRFEWSAEVDPADALALATTWFDLAQHLSQEADVRGFPLSPPEGEAFYQAVVTGVLDGLVDASATDPELAAKLRRLWPGLG
jgi:hypothetical protein